MPSNSDFKLEILIADTPVPEYSENEEHFVECNLSTPVSYMHQQCDVINGEKEIQSWPVTPYRIRIKASQTTDTEYPKYFRVMVDGVKVKGISLEPGESKVIKGFRDGSCIREFLFSMPRFAKDSLDRIESHRHAAVGKIVVECWDAVLHRSKWSLRSKYLDFKQANKKDSSQVTEGKYTMATSCPGKVVSGRAIHRLVDSWKLRTLRSSITVSYHMSHTLLEKGFTIQSLNIPPENIKPTQTHQDISDVTSSADKDIKKEPSGIPDRPAVPEVIDLTDDCGHERSAQELAMDLSVKSRSSDTLLDSNTVSNREDLNVIEDQEDDDDVQVITQKAGDEPVKAETVLVDGEVDMAEQVEEINVDVDNPITEVHGDEVEVEKEVEMAGNVENIEMDMQEDVETESNTESAEQSHSSMESKVCEGNIDSETQVCGASNSESKNKDGKTMEVTSTDLEVVGVESLGFSARETSETEHKDNFEETADESAAKAQGDHVDNTVTSDIVEADGDDKPSDELSQLVSEESKKETESAVQNEEKEQNEKDLGTCAEEKSKEKDSPQNISENTSSHPEGATESREQTDQGAEKQDLCSDEQSKVDTKGVESENV